MCLQLIMGSLRKAESERMQGASYPPACQRVYSLKALNEYSQTLLLDVHINICIGNLISINISLM
jgi:hypothetical protein